ncbi:hypothetical protein AX769_20970 (plasmid) [Frondihabitans sp. PAMC 28766]|uniref:TMEM175 family protein n=1 Tax=Frondihabitans sp. PAMC 28766 TaxID=1795630 RepID=UPI00078DC81E|nr:TMEM175 family protein [Frondihabitans sp. PAMC 28766]AMM22616.1 hypothetical protein AX769_20970 [Frondihabitans sp. PAMC 28766]
MTKTPNPAQNVFERGFERLNALSDGVVAIAITLLIFPITALATGSHGENVLTIITDHESKFITFLITFFVIAILWVGSHRLYRDVIAYTGALLWTQMVWLLSIVFIPFPMDVLASVNDVIFPNSAVYAGTLLLASSALLVEYAIVYRTPALQAKNVNLRPGLISASISTASVAAAFALTLLTPQLGLKPLVLLAAGIIAGQIVARRGRGRPADGSDAQDR